ncbi:hypothetical protein MBLNU459_g7827t2 [Dothideomycetes sp. NU459]
MRAQFILLLVVGLAVASAASLDAFEWNSHHITIPVPAHETSLSKLLKPFRKLLDKIFHRGVPGPKEQKVVAELPWSLVNFPSYANWTSSGWNIHVHGNLYKRRGLDKFPEKSIDSLLDKILLRATVKKQNFWNKNAEWLTPEEVDRGRDFVREIATYNIRDAVINATLLDGDCTSHLPYTTNSEGSVAAWIASDPSCYDRLPRGNESSTVANTSLTLNPVRVPGEQDPSNLGLNTAQTFFVPPQGLSIVSDIDDVLRVAEVWNPKQAILNLLTRPFQPWLNMSDVYWQVTAKLYINGTITQYPPGSFDFRPILNMSTKADLLHPRLVNIQRLMSSFPQRKFVLVGDTSSPGLVKGYASLAKHWPDRVKCILMRDTAATEPADWLVPATRHFKSLPPNKYLFFRTPSGPVHPTLADLETEYLRTLASSNDTTAGCFPMERPIHSSLQINGRIGTGLLSVLRWAAWGTVCEFIPRHRRPNERCRFDRRPGTVYWDGRVEGPHDV